jgi:hypothetical protein
MTALKAESLIVDALADLRAAKVAINRDDIGRAEQLAARAAQELRDARLAQAAAVANQPTARK